MSEAKARVVLIGLLIAHVAAWTLYGSIALGFGSIHGDMATTKAFSVWNYAASSVFTWRK